MGGIQPGELWRPTTEAQLLQAASNGLLEETHHLDIKREVGSSTGSAKEAARDMASFAVDGGLILFGFDESREDGVPPRANPFDTQGFPERLEAVARTRCFPPLHVASSVVGSDEKPGAGYVLTRIAPSESAPHMVEGRYYGRGDKTKVVLSDAEVMTLHERRIRQQKHLQGDVTDYLEPFLASSVAKSGLIGIVAQPTTALQPLLLDLLQSPNWSRDALNLVHNTGALPGEHYSPNPSYATDAQRRNGGVALTYGFTAGRVIDVAHDQVRDEPSAVEVELRETGELRYFQTQTTWTPITRDGEEATKTVRELTIVGDVSFLTRLAHVVATRSGYFGSWRLAIQVHGLTKGISATLADAFGVRLHPFTDHIYSRETTVAFDELAAQPDRVAGRLVLPLLYALNSADHPLWEYLR